MKSLKKLLLLIIISLFLTGCSSYTELNDLGIVSLLGIDYKDNNYQVYVSIIEGNQDDGTLEKEQITFHSEAKSLEQAFQKIMLQSNKKLYLSHIDSLLLTESLINNKLQSTINNFLNNNEYRNNFNIIMVNSDITDFFDNDITSEEINKLISINEKESGTSSQIDFEIFLKNLLIDSNSYLPQISYNEDHLQIDGFALIKNYHILSSLTNEESLLFNLMTNKVNHAIWNNITIYENETTIKTNKNEVTMTLNITTDNKEKIKKELKPKLKELWLYYQEKNYDLLKLQNKIKQDDYTYYKKQKKLLSKIKLNIKINATQKNNYIEEG